MIRIEIELVFRVVGFAGLAGLAFAKECGKSWALVKRSAR